MFSDLFRSICQVGVFVICAQAIVHFRPKGSYEKYLKVLVSTMVLIQIFLPISRLFSKDIQTDIVVLVEQFENQLNQSMVNVKESVAASEEYAETMAKKQLEELKKEQAAEGEQPRKEQAIEKIRIKVGQ